MKIIKKIKEILQSIRVVIDVSEWSEDLMEEYKKLHTTNKEQKEFLLLLIKQFWQKCPDKTKTLIFQYYKYFKNLIVFKYW